ncbi:MAG: hypothetical protein OXR66_07780 [Candidatus Woesearchaeota archaeon]|nr:hypothetical protein [Candidatus Woesearchaeota archaeon]
MVNMTIAVPAELKERMDCEETVNWSAVARESFEQRLHDLAFLREFSKKSTMTEDDAVQLGKRVNKRVSAKYRKLYGAYRKASGKPQ